MVNKKNPTPQSLVEKIVSGVLVILVLFLVFSLVGNILRVKRVTSKVEEKRLEIDKLQKEKEELLQKNLEAESEEFIERQLRDNLGLAKEGEIVLVMPPDEVVRKYAPQSVEEDEVLPDPNWKKWAHLFGF